MGTQLCESLEIRDTTASTKYPIANPHQGKFRAEVSRYLGNSRYTGNSTKAWYLLADPSDLPVIEVAFLNGQESPTIETAEADFNVLGIQMRGYHDFGVALQDPRGGVKSQGRGVTNHSFTKEQPNMATAIFVQDDDTIDYTPTADVAAGDVVVQGTRGRGPQADPGQHTRRPGGRGRIRLPQGDRDRLGHDGRHEGLLGRDEPGGHGHGRHAPVAGQDHRGCADADTTVRVRLFQ